MDCRRVPNENIPTGFDGAEKGQPAAGELLFFSAKTREQVKFLLVMRVNGGCCSLWSTSRPVHCGAMKQHRSTKCAETHAVGAKAPSFEHDSFLHLKQVKYSTTSSHVSDMERSLYKASSSLRSYYAPE